MRRSKAPSMIGKNKRFCNNLNLENNRDAAEDVEEYKWGSKEKPSGNLDANKRIFNILWREFTKKKNKTWTGVGSLEINVSSMKAVLKDETGKYMGCANNFKLSELQEDTAMLVGSKEIEIQSELKDENEISELRKSQIRNCEEQLMSPEEQAVENKKPKGGFKFKPLLVLKPLKMPNSLQLGIKPPETKKVENWGTTLWNKDNISKPESKSRDINNKYKLDQMNVKITTHTYKYQNFMCFVKPSELQQYLFQLIKEYCSKFHINGEGLNSTQIPHILEQICNHPSFIKHVPRTNKLIEFLTTSLPDWSEMGPFDSAKLEFVQYSLQHLVGQIRENLVIIAKTINALNMLQGLCDFMHIQCLRISTNDSEDMKSKILHQYLDNSGVGNSNKVLLTTSMANLKDCGHLFEEQKFIVFENVPAILNEFKNVENLKLAKVYYLVTAFSAEELLILYSLENKSNINFDEILHLFDIDIDNTHVCYIHSKIKEYINSSTDFHIFKDWSYLERPFDGQYLKESGLENLSEGLINIFSSEQY